MKTSHIIILIAVIIIGLLFLFGGQSDEDTDVMVADDTTSEVVSEVEDDVVSDEAIEMDQALPGTDTEEMMVEHEMAPGDTMIMDPSADKGGEVSTKTFTVDAFSYGYSLKEIRVKQGDTVTINLTNSSGFHDWVLDEFGVATEKIQAGGNTSVTFVAGKKGTFEYYCSVGAHRAQGMVGNLIVE